MYREIRRALQSLYVKDAWGWGHMSDSNQVRPVDVSELPGPCGGRRLLVAPQSAGSLSQSQSVAARELPKVWVGPSGETLSPATVAKEAPFVRKGPGRRAARRKAPDTAVPPLPSLVAGAAAVQPIAFDGPPA